MVQSVCRSVHQHACLHARHRAGIQRERADLVWQEGARAHSPLGGNKILNSTLLLPRASSWVSVPLLHSRLSLAQDRGQCVEQVKEAAGSNLIGLPLPLDELSPHP